MVVNSYNMEFGYELLSAIPYAYELHLQGKLTETISGIGSEPLYYFSPKHTINDNPRSWFNTATARKNGLPYTYIHKPERPALKFPQYKEYYKNDEYRWNKPTLCICNRYNVEWGVRPINYFDTDILDWLFDNLKQHYEIVYFSVDIPDDLQDNARSIDLDDITVCEKHNVKVFQQIKGNSWNESMLKVFANCEHYITMNGGYSIMASLFGGTNIIYTKKGNPEAKEIALNSFTRWYSNHSNQRTVEVNTYDELKAKIQAIYIDKLPCINIIVRTSNRPKAFETCIKSIAIQDYPNINLVITTDEPKGVEYTRNVKARHIHIEKKNIEICEKPESDNYGIQFIANKYLDIAQRLVTGYIMFLDDDDMFTCNDAVSIIANNVDENKLMVWKVDFNHGKILPNGSFGKQVKLYDITGIGICYHSKHVDLTDWTPWKRADFRTAKNISDRIGIKWIDAILTKLQTNPGMGKQRDVLTFKMGNMVTIRIIETGRVKRVTPEVAKECVKTGYAEYFADVVDQINKPLSRETKVITSAPEIKPLQVETVEKKKQTNKRRK